jgi:hypothetical protein
MTSFRAENIQDVVPIKSDFGNAASAMIKEIAETRQNGRFAGDGDGQFKLVGDGNNQGIVPTEKRKEMDALADAALNAPPPEQVPSLSPTELAQAQAVRDLTIGQYDTLMGGPESIAEHNKLMDQLKDTLKGLSPQEVQKIFDAINPDLSEHGLRLARVPETGEIWLGMHSDTSGQFERFMSFKSRKLDFSVPS